MKRTSPAVLCNGRGSLSFLVRIAPSLENLCSYQQRYYKEITTNPPTPIVEHLMPYPDQPFNLYLAPAFIVPLGDKKACEVYIHPNEPWLIFHLYGLETVGKLSIEGEAYGEPAVCSYNTPKCDCCEDGMHKPYYSTDFVLSVFTSAEEPTGHILIPALDEGSSDFRLDWLTTPSGSLVYGTSDRVYKPSRAEGEPLLA